MPEIEILNGMADKLKAVQKLYDAKWLIAIDKGEVQVTYQFFRDCFGKEDSFVVSNENLHVYKQHGGIEYCAVAWKGEWDEAEYAQ